MKLKTLKDINEWDKTPYYLEEELKEVAIKWANRYNEKRRLIL